MIQNTQIESPKMAVMSVDVVWTAEFATRATPRPCPPIVPDRGLFESRC